MRLFNTSFKKKTASWLPLLAVVGLVIGLAGGVHGQAELSWLDIGDFQYRYASVSGEPSLTSPPFRGFVEFWPGIYWEEGGPHVRTSHFIMRKNFTDAKGELWEHKVSHAGPRIFGLGEFNPLPMKLVGRFPKPEVNVDGLQSFLRPTVLTEVDPSIKADRILVREAHTTTGISWKETIYAFGNEWHDDYHIREVVWTNTGITSDNGEPDVEGQTAEDVMFYYTTKKHWWGARGGQGLGRLQSGSGSNTMWDYIGDGKEDYGTHHRVFTGWRGNVPWDKGTSLGTPVWTDEPAQIAEGDSTGRLGFAHMNFRGFLHADASASDPTNDPGQPSHTGFLRGGDNITNTNEDTNREQMADEYNYAHPDLVYAEYGNPGADGHFYPHEADLSSPETPAGSYMSESWYERIGNQVDLPNRGHGGGRCPTFALGPYTLAPGEDVRMVWVEGFAGLDRLSSVKVGEAYKDAGGDDNALITYNGASHTKNRWVLSAADSVVKTMDRAEEAWNSGLNIALPPKPPSVFNVTSGSDRIVLSWDVFGDADHNSFEIYRTRNRYRGTPEDDWQYELIASLGAADRQYADTDVIRGLSYFYYIQSVGGTNSDATGLTPAGAAMKSSRYYTQTYDPAFLKRTPGNSLASIRVVPNPYVLESDSNIRFPDQQDKLAFFDIPGECTIQIFSELGEAIQQINHSDGSGDEFWNLTTSSNQLVTSGIYFAVIRDSQSGEKIIKKFAIIR